MLRAPKHSLYNRRKNMRILLTSILTTVLTCNLFAVTATKELNPHLLQIFEQMQMEATASDLLGKEVVAQLTVKFATEKFLIFSDAYLQADEETNYQIGKWIFKPEQITQFNMKRGDLVTVKLKIEEIRTESLYAEMPHFVATIISIAPSRKPIDPDGGIHSESPRSAL